MKQLEFFTSLAFDKKKTHKSMQRLKNNEWPVFSMLFWKRSKNITGYVSVERICRMVKRQSTHPILMNFHHNLQSKCTISTYCV